ncbi:MAG: DEAD/DEAH box helicase [Candidatus Cyclobacteriaceae bacterium M3_2C_046]
MLKIIKEKLGEIKKSSEISNQDYLQATALFRDEHCIMVAQSKNHFELLVEDPKQRNQVSIFINQEENIITALTNEKKPGWTVPALAALMQVEYEEQRFALPDNMEGKKYTREGMKRRVLNEREQKAKYANYKIQLADNIYGEHLVTNERGLKYMVTLHDFEKEIGYSNNMDWRTNKLGTTKHIIFLFKYFKEHPELFDRLSHEYPWVEIYLDPLQDYQISWHFPDEMNEEVESLLGKYFGKEKHIAENQVADFLGFLQAAEEFEEILVRPEVNEKVEQEYNRLAITKLAATTSIDFSKIKAELFPYQQEGVTFATFKEGAIIADEMGLGKTIQAISIAVAKKEIFGLSKTLVICPASLKEQWKKEIERFTDEKAEILEGLPKKRASSYKNSDAYFQIVNYELVLRDSRAINQAHFDFIILDEAQRIKNYDTKTSSAIKSLKKKHALVITGTPIENKLLDLYSVTAFIDPYFLSPLWEFSYQHCLFDSANENKITGYYNLQQLKDKMKHILIRREKRNVIKQLPHIRRITVPVTLTDRQREYHASSASGVAAILSKKFITPFDMQRLMLLLNNMRMACDSSFLIDKETYESSKLVELKAILTEKLDLQNSDRKIIIFSEWMRMNKLIGELLREMNIAFTELNSKVAVKKRGELIKKFESDPQIKVFLSTEAGGAGLNLQMADTVINFELPWNPAKKNQRIGRIDRIGQKSKQLTVIDLVAVNSIEMDIAAGLEVKQNLFEGVLDSQDNTNEVDLSKRGKEQFLEDMRNMLANMEQPETVVTEENEPEEEYLDLEIVQTEASDGDHQQSDQQLDPETKKAVVEKESESITEQQHYEQVEKVMQDGMNFLSGMFKMSTGKEMGAENAKIEVDRQTGEVTMKFKLPGM